MEIGMWYSSNIFKEKRMRPKTVAKKVFKGEGYIIFSYSHPSVIALINPLKIYKKYLDKGGYFRRRFLFQMLAGRIDITKDENIVFSEFTRTIYATPEELAQDIKKRFGEYSWQYRKYYSERS